MPAAAALIPVATGIIGNIASSGDRNQSIAAQEAALQALAGVNTPSVEQMQLALQQYQSAGKLTPEQETALQQAQSQLNGYKTDPRLVQAQASALQSLQDRGKQGLTAQDIAALNQERNSTNQNIQSNNAAILASQAARGQLDSGNTLAAQLMGSQAAANREAQQGDNTAAMAQQNALSAMTQAGNMAGSMNTQQFGQAAQIAAAQDAINRFNTQNSQSVNNQNVQTNNAAQQYNLNNAQNIANANTGVANSQQQYNKGLYQTVFNDQLNKAKAVGGQDNSMSNMYANNANATSNMWSGMGNAAGQGVAAYSALSKKSPSTSENGYGADAATNAEDNAAGAYTGPQIPTIENGSLAGPPKPYYKGGLVSGKEVVPGSSPLNDNQPAMLSAGEIVLPKEIASSPKAAKSFVELVHHLKKNKDNK